jgi:XTP/dITP diphosphohydrolase
MALCLYIATTSPGKLRDFRTAAEAYSIQIEPLPALATIPPPEEDGITFFANANLKALYYSRFARFAADSGLIDSPDANDNSDVWNNMVLLQRMAAASAGPRTARYRCVLVAARDGKRVQAAEGSVEGLILEAPRGTDGFGYDPLFYLPDLNHTMAEIDLETKLSLSHRGRAIAALIPLLTA